MTYDLYFHPLALKEWQKLNQDVKVKFKKILQRRLIQPYVASARLSSSLSHCYKIKLRQSGYRLVYTVKDKRCQVLVVAVGRRENNIIYEHAKKRV